MSVASQYDNGWAYGYGIDLMYEPGIDDNLRAAWTHTAAAKPEKAQRVRFDPKADGINDYMYGGGDDWRTLRSGICGRLVGEQSAPVTCPAAP